MTIEMKVLSSHKDWLENRSAGIGGSEAAAIVGMNPYMSNVELWELKTGRRKAEDISDKPYVKYGHQAEIHLRELFGLDFPQYEVHYVDNNSFTNSKYPWALASLDGWLTDDEGRTGILEIKTTEIMQSIQKEKWNNQIPDNYYIQVLHYMMVLEADFAVLKAQLKSQFDGVPTLQTRHYIIERAEVEDDIQFLIKAEKEFWKSVQEDRKPALRLPNI